MKKKIVRKQDCLIFCEPFVSEPNWYTIKSYKEVFEAIRKDIDENIYTWTWPPDELKPIANDEDLTKKLKIILPSCPDLFKSNSPEARKLVAHFGELHWQSLYAQNTQKRNEATEAISDMLSYKYVKHAKGSKVYIPPLLSLNDMVAYIHRITKHLKSQVCPEDDLNDPQASYFTDPRLRDLVKKNKEYIYILYKKPKELTKKLVADFFGLTLKGLNQKLKQEKHPLHACQKR